MNSDEIAKKLNTIKKPLITPYPKGLSIIMMCRNEEKNIGHAIQSFLPVADQIVINDTGSTDNTLKIINDIDGPIKLIQNKWENNFALARNQALREAKFSWGMYLDADDIIPFTEYEGITKLKTKAPLDRCFAFSILNTRPGLDLAYSPVCMQTRMFPNHEKVFFERRVHEQVIGSLAELGLYDVPLKGKIIHTGYATEEERKRKAIRNLDLAMMEPELLENDATFIMTCGDSYYILEEWLNGINMYLRSMKLTLNKERKSVLACDIGKGYAKLDNIPMAMKYLNWAYALNETNIEALYYKAELYKKRGKIEKAVDTYKSVLRITQYKPTVVVNQFNLTRICSYNELGNIYIKKNMYYEAIGIFKEMLSRYASVAEGWKNLSICYNQIGKPELEKTALSEYERLTNA